MKVLRVKYLLHWLEEADALRMLKGVEGAPQETALSPLSSGTPGRVGLLRGDHESAQPRCQASAELPLQASSRATSMQCLIWLPLWIFILTWLPLTKGAPHGRCVTVLPMGT